MYYPTITHEKVAEIILSSGEQYYMFPTYNAGLFSDVTSILNGAIRGQYQAFQTAHYDNVSRTSDTTKVNARSVERYQTVMVAVPQEITDLYVIPANETEEEKAEREKQIVQYFTRK